MYFQVLTLYAGHLAFNNLPALTRVDGMLDHATTGPQSIAANGIVHLHVLHGDVRHRGGGGPLVAVLCVVFGRVPLVVVLCVVLCVRVCCVVLCCVVLCCVVLCCVVLCDVM